MDECKMQSEPRGQTTRRKKKPARSKGTGTYARDHQSNNKRPAVEPEVQRGTYTIKPPPVIEKGGTRVNSPTQKYWFKKNIRWFERKEKEACQSI